MMSENVFYIYLFISIIWFYIGSMVVWRFAAPEMYRLLIKKEDISRHEILQKEKEKKERKENRKKGK